MNAAYPFRSAALAWACVAALTTVAAAAEFIVPPTPDHYVVDAAKALDAETQTALESELRAFERATGHQVVLYVAQTTAGVPLETYTAQTAHTWRIGRKGKDDGAILFLFSKDHAVRIEVGYGLEGSLTDATSSAIIQNQIVPRMRAGDVDGAVTGGIAAMLAAIDPSFASTSPVAPAESSETSNRSPSDGRWFEALFLLVFFGPWIFVIWRIVVAARRGQLVTSRGTSSGSSIGGAFSSSNDSSSDSSDDSSDFDAGGGDFGGGGASGSW